jgi:hypothetical protein
MCAEKENTQASLRPSRLCGLFCMPVLVAASLDWAIRRINMLTQIAKSLYSGFTTSVGGKSMPAPTVALVPGSMRMNEPVNRLVL